MVIKKGDKGEKVERIQRALLIRFGFMLDVDGDFGSATDDAVREFQRQRGLQVDGKVGKDTLLALGLDPDTLEELPDEEVVDIINFEPDDVNVPPVVQNKIRDYVGLIDKQNQALLISLLGALDQFESTMSFASEDEAEADVLGTLASKAFDMAVDEMLSFEIPGLGSIPGLSHVKTLYEATTEELARAAKASESLEVGNWIKDQRAILLDWTRQGHTQAKLNQLQADIESDYLEQDEGARQAFFEQLDKVNTHLSGVNVPSPDELEANLYVQWINGHFKGDGKDDSYIEYGLEYFDETYEFKYCRVKAPFGDKVATGLNRLLDRGNLPGIQRPFDFQVPKRVCLKVDAIAGGITWDCGMLNSQGKIIHNPVNNNALKGLHAHDFRWRFMADRFGG